MYMFIVKHMILYSDCVVKLLAYARFFSFFFFLSHFCIMLVLCLFAHFLSFMPFPFVLTLPHFFTWQEKTRSYQVPNSFLPSSSYPISSVARESLINPCSAGLLAMDKKKSLYALNWNKNTSVYLRKGPFGRPWPQLVWSGEGRPMQSQCRPSGRHSLWHVFWHKIVTCV